MNRGKLIKSVEAPQRKKTLPDLRTGDTVKVHYKIREGGKERIQIFEGLVIATKKLQTLQASVTVRKISLGVGIERTFPLHSPWITKIERVKRSRVRQAKLYFVRRFTKSTRQLRLKDKGLKGEVWEDVVAVAPSETEEPLSDTPEAEAPEPKSEKNDDQTEPRAGDEGGGSSGAAAQEEKVSDSQAEPKN